MFQVDSRFIDEVGKPGELFDATACMNCGVCTAVCEMGIEILPRKLFRYVVLGIRDKVVENVEAVYSCLLCRICEVSCPAKVHVAENVRTLRYYFTKNVFRL